MTIAMPVDPAAARTEQRSFLADERRPARIAYARVLIEVIGSAKAILYPGLQGADVAGSGNELPCRGRHLVGLWRRERRSEPRDLAPIYHGRTMIGRRV